MELERCPFCGDKARKVYSIGQYGAFGYIECDLCECKTKSVKVIGPSQFETEDGFYSQRAWDCVVRNWNRRPDVKPA